MTDQSITIIQCWKLSFKNEILAEIQHSLNGLLPGTILADPERRINWKVLGRIIYIQLENQIHFDGEKEIFQHFSFQDPKIENFQKLQRQIAEKEKSNIFLYSIEPIGHEERPFNGEKLYVQ